MLIIVSNCQHCNLQQLQRLSCVHYTIFSVVKFDILRRALLPDRILALKKTTHTLRVHLVRDCHTDVKKIIIILSIVLQTFSGWILLKFQFVTLHVYVLKTIVYA